MLLLDFVSLLQVLGTQLTWEGADYFSSCPNRKSWKLNLVTTIVCHMMSVPLCFLLSLVLYLLLVQHVELISGAHVKTGVPVVVGWTVVRGAVVDGVLMQGIVVRWPVEGGSVKGRAAEGGTVEGGAVEGRTVEGGAVVGRTLVRRAVVGRSVEGVGVGAMMVMMIGGGDGTPCIWKGERKEKQVGRGGGRTAEGGIQVSQDFGEKAVNL